MKRKYLYLLAGVCAITWLHADLLHLDLPSLGGQPATPQTTTPPQNVPTAAKVLPAQDIGPGDPVYLSALGKKLSRATWNEYAQTPKFEYGGSAPWCQGGTGPSHSCVAMEGAICGQSTHQTASIPEITCSYDTGDSGVLPPRTWVILKADSPGIKYRIKDLFSDDGNKSAPVPVWIKSNNADEYLSADADGQLKLSTSNPGKSETWNLRKFQGSTAQGEDKYTFESVGQDGCLFAYFDQGQLKVNHKGGYAKDRNTLDPALVGTFWSLSK